MSAIVVVTTVGNQEQANLLAEELVARRHACCVNILRVERSVYRWQGRMCDDSEYMLIVKSLDEAYDEVEATIRELHSYDLPEILAFNVGKGEAGFLHWISSCVGGAPDEELDEEAVASEGLDEDS